MKKQRLHQKPGIAFWFWIIFVAFFAVFCYASITFGVVSQKLLLNQTAQEAWNLFEVYAEYTDESLETINRYMYQTLLDTEAVKLLERNGSKTERSRSQKTISDALADIIAWDENVDSILFYSPEGTAKELLETGNSSDYAQRQILKEQVKGHIDGLIWAETTLQQDYLTISIGEASYLVRIYKINGSYACAAVKTEHVLTLLSEALGEDGVVVFLSDEEGDILKSSDDTVDNIDVAVNGAEIIVGQERYLQVLYQSEEGEYYLGAWLPVNAFYQKIKLFQRIFWMMLFVMLLILPVYMLVIRRLLVKPIQELEQDMNRIGNGEWEITVENRVRVKEFAHLAETFNHMVVRIRELKIANYEKALEVKKLELQYLQLQNKPHFYLNALNIIYSLAQTRDYQMIQKMTLALVRYLRYTFTDMETLVFLKDELSHVKSYIEIQQMRFSGTLNYEEHVPKELDHMMVPPFVLQSFMENSVKYALRNKEDNVISVSAQCVFLDGQDYLVLEIRDNGAGYDEAFLSAGDTATALDEDKKYHVGIRNVRERLRILYGEKAHLLLSNQHGAVTTIQIPMIGDCLDE